MDQPENKFTTAPASGPRPRPGSAVGGAGGRCGADPQTCWRAALRLVGPATRRPGWGCTETGRRLELVPTAGSAMDPGMDQVRTGGLTHRWRRRRWRSMLSSCRSMSAWFFCSWTRRWLVPGVRLESQHTAGSEGPIWQLILSPSIKQLHIFSDVLRSTQTGSEPTKRFTEKNPKSVAESFRPTCRLHFSDQP